MKSVGILFILLMGVGGAGAQEIIVSGFQQSVINYSLEQDIRIPAGVTKLTVSFVTPQDFQSETYQLKVNSVDVTLDPPPSSQEKQTDQYGNLVRYFYWEKPAPSVKFVTAIKADTRVNLQLLRSEAPFPTADFPSAFAVFLQATPMVQSDDPALRKQVTQLTAGSTSQFQAVQAILHYIADRLHYVLIPEQYDALYAYRTGKGNCQNYSHLAAAMMRAVGIPVRIVNGITFKRSYSIPVENSEYSFEMAEGRHSWVEVYFPDAGWLPFDPQQTEFFVSNRYLRIEIGKDNEETIQDGLVRWSKLTNSGNEIPGLEELIASDFVSDENRFRSEGKLAGPKRLLLTPPLEFTGAEPEILAVQPPPEKPPADREKPDESLPPETISDIDYQSLKYEIPLQSGNLEFPRGFDFLSAYLMDQSKESGTGELKRHFIVETAEYVTGKNQYAQVFELDQPLLLESIALGLHHFGGDGDLWIDLCEDDGGNPGPPALSSRRVQARSIRVPTGYDWIVFDFSGERAILSPGKYWFTLNYSGSPIVNWFYSYGKPVGPVDGTREKIRGEQRWGKILSYEFNYRVKGLTAATN